MFCVIRQIKRIFVTPIDVFLSLFMHFVYLLLGANMGNSKLTLQKALLSIEKDIGKRIKFSAYYETSPWGVVNQPNYLNQVVKVATSLSPREILDKVLAIEEQLGRTRKEKWEARVIDIDILYFDHAIIDEPDLKIPHPLLHLRSFVLIPLAEIAPDFVHPILKLSTFALLDRLNEDAMVKKIN